jgi:hypothetical protein
MFKMEIFLNCIKADQFMCDVVQSQCIILLTDMKEPSYWGFLWQISSFTSQIVLHGCQQHRALMLYQLGVLWGPHIVV